MKYRCKELGVIKTLEEIEKEYFVISSNVDFRKEKIEGWNTFKNYLKNEYDEIK